MFWTQLWILFRCSSAQCMKTFHFPSAAVGSAQNSGCQCGVATPDNLFLVIYFVCYFCADTKVFLSFPFCLSLLLFNERWSKGIYTMRKSWKLLLRVLWSVWMGMRSLIKTTWQTFRQRRSCWSNLLELFEDITATRDKGKSVNVVYLNSEGFWIQKEHPHCGLAGKVWGRGGGSVQEQVCWETASEWKWMKWVF